MRPDATLDLQEQLSVLWRRKWSIALITLLALGISLALTLQQDERYSASARLLVELEGSFQSDIETEAQRVTSVPVANGVIEALGLDENAQSLLSDLSIRPLTDEGSVIAVTFTDEDPEYAAAVADAFAGEYLAQRRVRVTENASQSAALLEDLIAETRADLEEVIASIGEARGANRDDDVAVLESERALLVTALGAQQQRLADAQLNAASEEGVGELLEPARVPDDPSEPDLVKNLIFAGLAGLAVGLVLAFVRERLDNKFSDRSTVERVTGSPVLGAIPRFSSRKGDSSPILVRDPTHAASEGYRNLRANLEYVLVRDGIRSVLITSPEASEGKTETVRNLGIAFARSGRRVLLVSADFRKPGLEEGFGISGEKGLSDLLVTEGTGNGSSAAVHLRPYIHETEVPDLLVMPVGSTPSGSVELLGSKRMEGLLRDIETAFDVVLIDSAPVLPAADAVLLAGAAHGSVLVVKAGSTKRSATILAAEQLDGVGTELLGTVLNAFDPKRASPASSQGRVSRRRGPGEARTKEASPTSTAPDRSAPTVTMGRRSVDPPPPPVGDN